MLDDAHSPALRYASVAIGRNGRGRDAYDHWGKVRYLSGADLRLSAEERGRTAAVGRTRPTTLLALRSPADARARTEARSSDSAKFILTERKRAGARMADDFYGAVDFLILLDGRAGGLLDDRGMPLLR